MGKVKKMMPNWVNVLDISGFLGPNEKKGERITLGREQGCRSVYSTGASYLRLLTGVLTFGWEGRLNFVEVEVLVFIIFD